MNHLTLLDGAVILGIAVVVLAGFRRGLLTAGGALMGLIVGIAASLATAPWVASKIDSQTLRLIVVVVLVVLLLSLFSSLGARIGHALRASFAWRPVRLLDGIGGAALHFAMAILFISMLVFGANTLGMSSVTRAVSASPVLQAIQKHTPGGVQSLFAQLRSPALAENLPKIHGRVLPGSVRAGADSSAQTDAVKAASASTVRVSGVASQCAQSQYGSGFVVAKDRVVTNAHVVAGVRDVVVEIPGSEAVQGRVVYYNPVKDLAVVATDGLAAQPLTLSSGAASGQSAAFIGYPLGGPLAIRAAAVQGLTNIAISGEDGSAQHGVKVYSLSGNVEQGNSGGPLVNLDGEVVGAVFAKSTSQANVGYALTMDELRPVIDEAPNLTETVSDGTCVRG